MSSWPISCWARRRPKGVALLGPDGLLSQVTKAVLEHPPRTLRSYFEELAAQPGPREPADTKETT
jgi:hypothetical protein